MSLPGRKRTGHPDGRTLAGGEPQAGGLDAGGVVGRFGQAEDKAAEAAKPKAEKPKTDKPKAYKPKAEKPKTDKPKADKPKAEKPKAAKPKAAKDDLDLEGLFASAVKDATERLNQGAP